MLLGIDTGGTFTDFVLFDGKDLRSHKVLSTPQAPEQAIMQGIAELGVSLEGLHVIHGSTVATNAVLEGKLASTMYVTNLGLRDTLTIGRQARRELYNLQPARVPPPVPADYCLEVGCRMTANGEQLESLSDEDKSRLLTQVEALQPDAVAINLLFSFLDDADERTIADSLPENCFVTRSSSLLPVYREFERGITTWLNAATGPLMKRYLDKLVLRLQPATLTIMQSSGDVIDAGQAVKTPANLLLSGPAGGLLGAKTMAGSAGLSRLMTFDMGGTSSDVALIDGDIQLTDEGEIAGYPISLPMVDMHTIGAGGGSLAWIDKGGLLQVGPQSAGASPGPACYGQGGKLPTVTDANVVLGHLPAVVTLAGELPLQDAAARKAVGMIADRLDCSVEQAAQGILMIANEHMVRALRVISIEKGHDPADFTLVSFGGAGGLHACDLAEALGMTTVFAPVHAGVLSALGMLAAPRGRRYMRTFMRAFSELDTQDLDLMFSQLEHSGRQALLEEGLPADEIVYQRMVDVRYIGQSSSLRLAYSSPEIMQQAFQDSHQKRYGHALQEPLELVNLHSSVQVPTAMPSLPKISLPDTQPFAEQAVHGCQRPVPVYQRLQLSAGLTLSGPLILVEPAATIWVKPGWQAALDNLGNLILSR